MKLLLLLLLLLTIMIMMIMIIMLIVLQGGGQGEQHGLRGPRPDIEEAPETGILFDSNTI